MPDDGHTAPTFLRLGVRDKAERNVFATAEHTVVRGFSKCWYPSKENIFRVAEKHSSNVSTLILCFARGHRKEKHEVNEVKTVDGISKGRRGTWSRNEIKIGANGVRFSREVSHALTRREPPMSLRDTIEERSCQ